MAEYLIQGSTLTSIADAIRAKTKSVGSIMPTDMANAISTIQSANSLIVNVESGSLVTCSNSDTGVSYSAISVNNEAVFDDITKGIWNLVAAKDNKTAVRTVEISDTEFAMAYETLVYANGDEYVELTGGWTTIATSGGDPSVTSRVNDGITWTQVQTSGSGVYVTTNPIDLSLFSKLEFQGNWNSHGVGNIIAISDDFTEWHDWKDFTVLSVPIEEIDWDNEETNPTVDPIQSIDISDLTGSYRIGIGLDGASSHSIVRMASFKLGQQHEILDNDSTEALESNFEVVGGIEAPSNPKENTIWVNTDVEIIGWHFSPAAPENMKHGEVWIATDPASAVAFNALKKNGIEVYPVFAKQYVDGTLVDVEAKIQQNSEWVEMLPDLVFFENGEFNTSVFGEISGTQSIQSDGSFRLYRNQAVTHNTPVDVSPYSTFQFEIPSMDWGYPTVTVTDAYGATIATFGRYTAAGLITADISAINKPVKIKIAVGGNNDGNTCTINNVKFSK
jgi:hypothetical protein